VGPTFAAPKVRLESTGRTLKIEIPPRALSRNPGLLSGGNRPLWRPSAWCWKLVAIRPWCARRAATAAWGLRSTAAQRAELQGPWFAARQSDQGMIPSNAPGVGSPKVPDPGRPPGWCRSRRGRAGLGTPGAGAVRDRATRLDPRLQALLSSRVTGRAQVRTRSSQPADADQAACGWIHLAQSPRNYACSQADGMQGPSSLPALAARDQAL